MYAPYVALELLTHLIIIKNQVVIFAQQEAIIMKLVYPTAHYAAWGNMDLSLDPLQ
jgi:hypothetical protein